MEREEKKITNGDFHAGNQRGGHLSDEEIIAYQYGNLSSVELERRAQNHLIECRRCTSILLELSSFAETANAPSGAVATDLQWQRFEQMRLQSHIEKLNPEELNPEGSNKEIAQILAAGPKTSASFGYNFSKFPSFNFASAAAFGALALIVCAGIFLAFFRTTENSDIRQSAAVINTPTTPNIAEREALEPENSVTQMPKTRLENDSRSSGSDNRIFKPRNQNSVTPLPKTKNKMADENSNSAAPKVVKTPAFQDELALNRIDVSLYPNEVVRGDEVEDLRKIRVRQNSVGQIRLKLNAPKSEAGETFSIEINDGQKKTVLALPVLPDRRGDFYLTIAASKLPAASYSLKIYAEKNKARRVYAEYGFEIVYE